MNIFQVGDKVSIGDWPRWCYRFHVPKWARKSIKFVLCRFGKKFGPELAVITGVFDVHTGI